MAVLWGVTVKLVFFHRHEETRDREEGWAEVAPSFGSQKVREPANLINMSKFPGSELNEKDEDWTLKSKYKMDKIACFVFVLRK